LKPQASASKSAVVTRFFFASQQRNYYPDLFHHKSNTFYEAKSTFTLGLKKASGLPVFLMTQAKAKATVAAGFHHILVVVFENREILALPERWTEMSWDEVKNLVFSVSKR
jgi:hypothetical protein